MEEVHLTHNLRVIREHYSSKDILHMPPLTHRYSLQESIIDIISVCIRPFTGRFVYGIQFSVGPSVPLSSTCRTITQKRFNQLA